VALTESDILGPSESFRSPMDYFAHSPQTSAILERLAQQQPTTLACMHGSAWRGDGEKLLLQLSVALTKPSTGGVSRPFGRSSVVLAHEVRGVQQ
jgi:hypothetical protein